MILNSKVIVNVIIIRCFFNRKMIWTVKKTFLLLNVISTLDFGKIFFLTYATLTTRKFNN